MCTGLANCSFSKIGNILPFTRQQPTSAVGEQKGKELLLGKRGLI